jgi:hypothetical protein
MLATDRLDAALWYLHKLLLGESHKMIEEDDFADAAEVSPEMAFVRLERKFRARFQNNIENSQSSESYNAYVREYMNHTISTADALGLDFLDDEFPFGASPHLNSSGERDQQLDRLTFLVDRFAVRAQINHIRRPPQDTVALDASEKRILRHYVEQIKEVIDNSPLLASKKERLFDRINHFLEEVDRDRTALQRFNDIVISLSHTGGEAVEELEPAWKWVKLIGSLLGARQENEQAKLPKPVTPKKLPSPKKINEPSPTPKSRNSDMDDDIPF